MKRPTQWFLIADGAQARIVSQLERDQETGSRLDDIIFDAEHKPLRKIMADKPGRSFASSDARRSAMEYHSDPVREQKSRFAEMLAEQLEKHRAAADFDRLVIIAEPRMLGLLRDALPAPLKSVVNAEIAKDLSNLPAAELYTAIAGLDTARPRL